MSRTVKYILTIALIIAAAMWIMAVYRSCDKTKKDDTSITTDDTNRNTGNATNNTEEDLEDLYDEEKEEDGANSGDPEETSIDPNPADASEDSEFEKTDEEVPVAGSGISNNGGEYLVVAGAFISKRNAELLQKQLSKKGYDSEIRVFIGSDYHSVILGEYATELGALSIAKKIGGEAYVHKKRYPKKRR